LSKATGGYLTDNAAVPGSNPASLNGARKYGCVYQN
jgi:hypothetical protein